MSGFVSLLGGFLYAGSLVALLALASTSTPKDEHIRVTFGTPTIVAVETPGVVLEADEAALDGKS